MDLHKFHHDTSYRGEALYIWLDVLLYRLPGFAVLVIAKHAGGFGGDRKQVAAALRLLEVEVNTHLELKGNERYTGKVAGHRTEESRERAMQVVASLTVYGVMEASGCRSEDLRRLRNAIRTLAEDGRQDADGKRLFPHIGETVPVSWARVWAMTAALHKGTEPAAAAQSYGDPVVPVDDCEAQLRYQGGRTRDMVVRGKKSQPRGRTRREQEGFTLRHRGGVEGFEVVSLVWQDGNNNQEATVRRARSHGE